MGEEDVFGAAGQVGFVLLGEGGDGEGVTAKLLIGIEIVHDSTRQLNLKFFTKILLKDNRLYQFA